MFTSFNFAAFPILFLAAYESSAQVGNPSIVLDSISDLTQSTSQIFQLSDADRPGSWCWFQDERVIIDTTNPTKPMMLTGVVTYALTGNNARGDIDLYWAELDSKANNYIGKKGRYEFDDQLQMDDHASPSFMIRPDGRYLVNWSKHGNDNFLRTVISKNPGDPTSWSTKSLTTPTGAGITYTNPQYLKNAQGGKGQIFNGVRSRGFDSNFLLSNDTGKTWVYGGRVLDAKDPWPDNADGGRAYVKYQGDGISKIHIFATDDHPRVNFNRAHTSPGPYLNSIYHAYIENNKLHRSNGTVIDANLSDDVAVAPTEMTVLLQDSTVVKGVAMRRGWLDDIHVTKEGNPFGIIQFRANDKPQDHRYFYVRFEKGKWNVNHLAYAGDYFGNPTEEDYIGLASVDPSNPDVVFISTSSNPVTGDSLVSSKTGKRQNEIYMGTTQDLGISWTWAPITKNSTSDNLRPIVPAWAKGKSLVLWMQGNYPKFYEYDTRILGMVLTHKTGITKVNQSSFPKSNSPFEISQVRYSNSTIHLKYFSSISQYEKRMARIHLYGLKGNKIETFLPFNINSGLNSLSFKLNSKIKKHLNAGIYYLVLQSAESSLSKELIVLDE